MGGAREGAAVPPALTPQPCGLQWPSSLAVRLMSAQERRRLKIIPNAFGEKAVLKMMFGAMIRAAERWHAIRFSEFERRQMAAVKQELDEEYEGATTFPSKPAEAAPRSRISSSSGT
jgi:putative transposase